jgi:hypothetical protein
MTDRQLATIHPSITYEHDLLKRSVAMAESAFADIDGGVEAKNCSVKLSAGRVLQGAARLSITHRLAAGKLALQEAKLIESK